MAEYLPLKGERASDRSRLEAQQRSAGLRPGDQTQFWHAWITHPTTGQEALVIQDDEDKAFLSATELTELLTEEQADADDWFMEFEGAEDGI